ncbi:hypothetical protein [Staphylococcus epidermidis]|uniref:hypothetical protein n=1 Tax=Staphylococcus epidermidis TaxID=1282 RepID=UPI0015D64B1C|nr:hypothetical protein [Staphylococcus epidermidis]
MNTKYFGETLEGTGQAEDYRLKLSPKKASQQYEVYFGETLEGTGQAEDYRLKLSPKKASQQYEVLL